MTGRVALVGAGPGAADLLTLRAARLLAEADLVLADALVGEDILALAVRARILNVGKRAGRASTDQAFINRLLVRSARRHALVVRLKGGDPMLFGRAQEEIEACRAAGIEIEIVPGVSAAFAAAADIATSLTRRQVSRSVVFVTPSQAAGGTSSSQDWVRAAAAADTAVLYMAKMDAQAVGDALTEAGISAATPVAVVADAGTGRQRVYAGALRDLAGLARSAGGAPAVLLVGEVFADALAPEACAETRRFGG